MRFKSGFGVSVKEEGIFSPYLQKNSNKIKMSKHNMLKPISFGDIVKPIQIEKLKGSEKHPMIVNFITSKVFAANVQYHEDVGYFYSFNGVDIDVVGLPRQKYIIPAIVYSGTPNSYGLPISIYYYPASPAVYEELRLKDSIIRKNEGDNVGLENKDVLMRCTDDVYQKINFETFGPCLWQKDQATARTVYGMIAEYENLIEPSVARVISEEKFKEAVGYDARMMQQQMSQPAVVSQQSQMALSTSSPHIAETSRVVSSQEANLLAQEASLRGVASPGNVVIDLGNDDDLSAFLKS